MGFARRCNPFGRRKVARILTCIKIISAFSAEIEPKGVRVLPTSCGRRTAGHDACHFEKEAENIANFRFRNVLTKCNCKQTDISLKHRQKRLRFRFKSVGGVLSRYANISRRNRRYFRYVTPQAVTVTSSAVTVTFRSTKRKFLPSLWVFGSVKGFVTITGSVTFISGGLISYCHYRHYSIEGHSGILSEQANRIQLSPWLKELQRKEESNSHRTNRTERTTTERAISLGWTLCRLCSLVRWIFNCRENFYHEEKKSSWLNSDIINNSSEKETGRAYFFLLLI